MFVFWNAISGLAFKIAEVGDQLSSFFIHDLETVVNFAVQNWAVVGKELTDCFQFLSKVFSVITWN